MNHQLTSTILIAAALALPAIAEDIIVINDVNVIPMDSERILEHRAVVVRDGRIAAIERAELYDIPAGATVIDGSGRYLMPGLADMHVHTWDVDEFTLFIANGVTTVRNLWGTEIHQNWQRQIEAGSVLGPTIYTAGALIDGEPPIWPQSAVATTPEKGRELVREQHEAGFRFIKVYNRLKRDVYDAIVDEAATVGIPVIGHVPDDVGLFEALKSNQFTIEHLSGYIHACQPENTDGINEWATPGLFATFDESMIPAAVEATLEAGTTNCVTLVVTTRTGGASEAELESWFSDPAMQYVNPSTRGTWERMRGSVREGESLELAHRAREVRRLLTAALHEAGAPILLGTDMPNPLVIPGFAIHDELANLVGAGMTPYGAIRCGTAGAAEHLEEENEFGTIAPGRRADLILLDENPLEDVANIRKRAGVMVRGNWLPEEEIEAKLAEIAARYAEIEQRAQEPAADPFADFDPLPLPGEATYEAAFEYQFGGSVVGHERFAIATNDAGEAVIIAQSLYTGFGNTKMSLEFVPGPDNTGTHMTITQQMGGGTFSYSVERDGAELRVSTNNGEPQVHTIDEHAFLGTTSIGAEHALDDVVASIDVGEEKTVHAVMLNVFPVFSMQNAAITYARGEDVEYETRWGETVTGRSMTITSSVDPNATSTAIYDEFGRVLRYEAASQMGTFLMERIR